MEIREQGNTIHVDDHYVDFIVDPPDLPPAALAPVCEVEIAGR